MSNYALYTTEYKDVSLKIRNGVEVTLESDFDMAPPGASDLVWGASETPRVRGPISLRLGLVFVLCELFSNFHSLLWELKRISALMLAICQRGHCQL